MLTSPLGESALLVSTNLFQICVIVLGCTLKISATSFMEFFLIFLLSSFSSLVSRCTTYYHSLLVNTGWFVVDEFSSSSWTSARRRGSVSNANWAPGRATRIGVTNSCASRATRVACVLNMVVCFLLLKWLQSSLWLKSFQSTSFCFLSSTKGTNCEPIVWVIVVARLCWVPYWYLAFSLSLGRGGTFYQSQQHLYCHQWVSSSSSGCFFLEWMVERLASLLLYSIL